MADSSPDIAGLVQRGVTPLSPFLAVCLRCGHERTIRADKVPRCKCGVRRWGIASCGHCRGLIGTDAR